MKVLMFGWEFPPFKSGGLGAACYTLTKGLAASGVDVAFVMPVAPGESPDFVRLVNAREFSKKVDFKSVPALLTAYTNIHAYDERYHALESEKKGVYGADLMGEVYRFTSAAEKIVEREEFEVIHCHDWMTFEAGMRAKRLSKKPLVMQVHATEADRTANNPNVQIVSIEKEGLMAADVIIANSQYTKRNIMRQYGIEGEKIRVVYLGVEERKERIRHVQREKTVLFVGRLTSQKGPERFLEVAEKVLEFEPAARFVIAGEGELKQRLMFTAAKLGLSEKVRFAGFLSGEEVESAFENAEVCVMPSVSEPFGLVALEALRSKTPVIISKQSGVSEVVSHCLKADFWDVEGMTDQIVNVLRSRALREELAENGFKETRSLSGEKYARQVRDVYEEVVNG